MIDITIKDGIGQITLNRPPVNAMNTEMMRRLIDAFDLLGEDRSVKVIVLAAEGKVFCAGADIKQRAGATSGPGARTAHNRNGREMLNAITDCAKPVIAAVQGAALGGGLCLAAAADIIVAAETAQFGLPEVGVGLLGGARHAMRILPHSLLREMVFTALPIGAPALLRIGAISRCVPREQVLTEALALAASIARHSPLAVGKAKLALNTIDMLSLREGYRFEQYMTNELSAALSAE